MTDTQLVQEWAFVGREATLGMLEHLVGAGRSAVVTGDAGSGKSRLLHELAARFEGPGVVRLVATATSTAIPFGALAPLVAVGDGQHGPVDVLAAARAGLRDRMAGGAGALLVDDAPRLDAGSATFLHQIVVDGLCPIVATARRGEREPDAIAALRGEPSVESVDLGLLDEPTIAELVEQALGGQCGVGVVHTLAKLSGGNPLSLRELVNHGRAQGWLTTSGGVWRVVGEAAAPPGLQELVGSHLTALGPQARAALEVVACVERIELDQISTLVAEDDLDRLESQGLLRVEVDGRRPIVALAHPLYGEAIRASLSTVRRRRIATDLAAMVEAAGFAAVGSVTRVVQWRLDAGADVDASLVTEAAREAWMASDFDLAERLATAARERGAGFDAGLILGETAMLTGRHDLAERVLSDLDDGSLVGEQLAGLANARAYNLAQNLDRDDDGLAVLENALERAGGEHGDLLRSRVVGIHALAPRPRRALELAEPMLAERGTELHRVAFAASIALATLGRLDEAVEIGRDGFVAHDRLRDTARQLPESQHVGPILAHVAAGRLDAAATLAADGRIRSAASFDHESQATFALLDGIVSMTAGRLRDAVRHFREAAAINADLDDRPALRWSLGGVCLSAALAGDGVEAAGALSHLDAVRPTGTRLLDALLVDRARAWERIVRHDLTGGGELLVAAAERARESEQHVAEAILLHDAVDVDGRAADADRLSAVADQIDGQLIAAMADHSRAVVDRDPDRLEAVAGTFIDLGVAVHAAIAASQAGRELARLGFDRRATAMDALVATALGSTQGATPPLLAERVAPVALTRREREVAQLAAQGLSNREIGEQLFVSVRTVENHLQRAYEKLGVTSRNELASALRPAP